MIEFYPISRPCLAKGELEYVVDAVQSGWVSSLGKYIDRFEDSFSRFCGTSDAITVSNGTSGLHLALKALNIGPGDEVIIPDLSFIATANAVVMSGASPVFVDIDYETLCLSPKQLEKCVTSRTRAIIAVHLYGHPADMDAIVDVARRKNLFEVEDAAEAHGARIGSKAVGTFGDCAVFSFYGNKTLTTGEGGVITTNDHRLASRCRLLRDHAMSNTRRYWHDELGYNYRMTNLQAALGCAQIERADQLVAGRKAIFELYAERLDGIKNLRLNRQSRWAKNSYWLVCVEVDGLCESSRDTLITELRYRGIDSRPYFYPMSDMPYLPDACTPVAHYVAVRGINLPTYVDLNSEDVEYICKNFLVCLKEILM